MSKHHQCGCGHDHGHHGPDHDCNCNCNHDHHENPLAHDQDACPVCSHGGTITPEEYLQKIEEAVNKIPTTNKKQRMDTLIIMTAGTAATAAEHQDLIMLQIIEVYLVLRLAEESGQSIGPEEASKLFRDLCKTIGLGLTAKYGLDGLMKVNIADESQPGPVTLIFLNCYSIGKVIAEYFRLMSKGKELREEEAKERYKKSKAEAERLIK